MDRAYEGNETRQLVLDLGFTPVVSPTSRRTTPCEYDREMYKKRNEVETLLRRLKGFRRILSRFDKLDIVFVFFIHFALICDSLRSVNTPLQIVSSIAAWFLELRRQGPDEMVSTDRQALSFVEPASVDSLNS